MKGGRSAFEAKTSSGARLYFTMLDIDTVLIVMASYKVEMNPKTVRETLFKRISDNIEQINEIKSKIENEDEKAKLIEENMLIKDRIMESLDAKTR